MPGACYIHVPFCAQICAYCDFSRIVHDRESERRYLHALTAEIALRARAGERLSTLYFGGGTPTTLSAESWETIFAALRRHFIFDDESEVTCEANPESATPENLALLRRLGINRLSMGVQSFDPANLRRMGRIHTPERVGAAVADARAAGFENISLDLICGLPDETDGTFREDLRRAVALEPQHLSLYALMLEKGVPLRGMVERGEVALPPEEHLARRWFEGIEILAKAGYRHYEISNFARPGREARHNLAYWEGRDYYGFGPSAVGTLGGVRYRNDGNIAAYVDRLDLGFLPPGEAERLDGAKRLRETMMLSLRLASGLDARRLSEEFGCDILRDRRELMERLERSGDLRVEGGRIVLTPRGMFRSDAIIVALWPEGASR